MDAPKLPENLSGVYCEGLKAQGQGHGSSSLYYFVEEIQGTEEGRELINDEQISQSTLTFIFKTQKQTTNVVVYIPR